MRIQFTRHDIMGFTDLFAVACRRLGLLLILFFLYGYQTARAQTNLALGKPVFASSQFNATSYPNSNLTDGKPNTFAHTGNSATAPNYEWFRIDLGADYYIENVVIKNRLDANQNRAQRFMLVTYPSTLAHLNANPNTYLSNARYNRLIYANGVSTTNLLGTGLGPAYTVLNLNVGIHRARYVYILTLQDDFLNLAEIEVYGTTKPPVRTFVNTGFESVAAGQIQEADVPGWSTTDGVSNNVAKGGNIEIWDSGALGVSSFEGSRFAELNAYMNGELSQDPICVLPGETFNWKLAHRGRAGVDVMRLRIDNVDVAQFTDNNVQAGTHTVSVLTPATTTATKGVTNAAGWTPYSGTWTNTSGVSKIVQFSFLAVSTGGDGNVAVGNFLDAVSIEGLQATVSLSPAAASGPESVATANLPKLRVNGAITTPQTVQVNITAASTATRGSDFTTSPATGLITVTIPAGNYDGTDSTAIPLAPYIQIQQDAIYPEPDETIVLSLQNPSTGLVIPTGNSCGMGETISVYTITDVCPPTAQITPSVTSLTTCSGDAGNIEYTTVPAGAEVHWTRMPGNLTGSGSVVDYPTVSGTTPESYTYTATVFTIGGCPSQTAVTVVTVNPIPIVTPSTCSQTICSGEEGNITFVSSIPGSTIHWLRVEDNLAGTGDISEVMNTAGNFTYKIWATSPAPASCPSSTTITCEVVVNNCCNLVANAGSDSPQCVGNTVHLTAYPTGGSSTYTYLWRGPNGFSSTTVNPTIPNATVAAAGSYTVVVTDAIIPNCSLTALVDVEIAVTPDLSLSTPAVTTICSGQSTSLTVNGANGASVIWTNNLGQSGTGTSINTGLIQNVGTQPLIIIYDIVATAGTCSDATSATIIVHPAPVIQVVPGSAVYCEIEQVHITAKSSVPTATINWTRTPNTPVPPPASGTGTGTVTVQQQLPAASYTYTFTATGTNGCSGPAVSAPVTVQQ